MNYERVIVAFVYSRRMRAMLMMEIPFGHAAWHSPWFEQPPNPSRSICSTMPMTRCLRSTWPCGNRANCEIFAPVNSAAEALGHAATQAPQPMQAAASMASSACSFGTRMALASGAEPVFTEM